MKHTRINLVQILFCNMFSLCESLGLNLVCNRFVIWWHSASAKSAANKTCPKVNLTARQILSKPPPIFWLMAAARVIFLNFVVKNSTNARIRMNTGELGTLFYFHSPTRTCSLQHVICVELLGPQVTVISLQQIPVPWFQYDPYVFYCWGRKSNCVRTDFACHLWAYHATHTGKKKHANLLSNKLGCQYALRKHPSGCISRLLIGCIVQKCCWDGESTNCMQIYQI